ncbi:integral membrane protein [Hypomontagnella monticulosa]|nr:integral membrane protein [Hypomontagnella monticulosa]
MSSDSIRFDPELVDESRGRDLIIPAVIFSVLVVLSTGMRIFSKLWFARKLSVDDLLIVIALAFNLTGNALEIQSAHNGWGRHLQFLNDEQRSMTRMLTLYNILISDIALWAVKLSASFFLLSLVTGVYNRAKWIIYALIVITTLASLSQLIVWSLQARPLEKLWHPEVPGTVASPYMLLYAHVTSQAVGAATDIFYALSPIYFFGKLQMSLRKKIVLISLTGSGLAVFAVSIAHLSFVNDFLDPDYTWALHRVFIFALVERNLAEVIANLPVSTPLFRSMYKNAKQVLANYTGGSTKTSGNPVDKGHVLSSVITIGSARKSAKKGATEGTFRAYGRDVQFTELNTISDDDQVKLWNDSQNKSDSAVSVSI